MTVKKNPYKIIEDNPLGSLLELIYLSLNSNPKHRQDVFRDEMGDIIIDSCCAHDTEMWETGISHNAGKNWKIVEQYDDRESAEMGHQKWVDAIKQNPNLELIDIFAAGDTDE